jgi:hypothetical protein
MTHIIESLLARTTKEVLNRKYKQKCGLSNKADKVIKYCKSCNYCWEPEFNTTRVKRGLLIMYYKDFPRYGKPRKECPKCESLQNKNT